MQSVHVHCEIGRQKMGALSKILTILGKPPTGFKASEDCGAIFLRKFSDPFNTVSGRSKLRK